MPRRLYFFFFSPTQFVIYYGHQTYTIVHKMYVKCNCPRLLTEACSGMYQTIPQVAYSPPVT